MQNKVFYERKYVVYGVDKFLVLGPLSKNENNRKDGWRKKTTYFN